MITVNGKVYDGVAVKPDLDEALEHYGVKGMKWRQHLKRATKSLQKIGRQARTDYKYIKGALKNGANRYNKYKKELKNAWRTGFVEGTNEGTRRNREKVNAVGPVLGGIKSTNYGTKFIGYDNGKAGYAGQGARIKEGIEAGRARRKKKKK